MASHVYLGDSVKPCTVLNSGCMKTNVPVRKPERVDSPRWPRNVGGEAKKRLGLWSAASFCPGANSPAVPIAAKNGSNGKREEPFTRCIAASAGLSGAPRPSYLPQQMGFGFWLHPLFTVAFQPVCSQIPILPSILRMFVEKEAAPSSVTPE